MQVYLTSPKAYWTSLTFLDPSAAILLFVFPRVGLLATLIVSSDVAHNLWLFTRYHVPYKWMLVARGAGE